MVVVTCVLLVGRLLGVVSMNIQGFAFDEKIYTPFQKFSNNFSGGVYVVIDTITWVVLDVGQTFKMSSRFPYHDRQDQWFQKSKNIGLLFHQEMNDQVRLQKERFLRAKLTPLCGDH